MPALPRRLAELRIAVLEAGAVGKVDGAAGQVDRLAVDLLEAHDEHRAVRFGEDGRADLDDVVGSDGEEEPIERGVVELAQGDAVADHRLALGVAVWRDVRRVQELLVAQPAEGAALGVGAKYPLTQRRRRAGGQGPARPDDLHPPPAAVRDPRPAPSAERPDGNRFVLFVAVAPLSARSCRSFTWNARTYKTEPEADAGLAAFQAVILDQDRPIAESQRPEALPIDLCAELHIAGPDRASIAYRRRLAELAGADLRN